MTDAEDRGFLRKIESIDRRIEFLKDRDREKLDKLLAPYKEYVSNHIGAFPSDGEETIVRCIHSECFNIYRWKDGYPNGSKSYCSEPCFRNKRDENSDDLEGNLELLEEFMEEKFGI